MRGKILLATGLAIGYVLGTRAGREKYDQLVASVRSFWNDPRVQKQVHSAEDFVKDKGPEAAEYVADQAKKVASRTTSKSSAPKPSDAASSAQ